MKFVPPTEQPMHIALTSGHTHVIEFNGGEGTETPALFVREAIARGAEPVGVEKAAPLEGKSFDRSQAIKDAINKMLDDPADEDYFTAAGLPDLRKLNTLVGFKVDRDEANKLFEEVTANKG